MMYGCSKSDAIDKRIAHLESLARSVDDRQAIAAIGKMISGLRDQRFKLDPVD